MKPPIDISPKAIEAVKDIIDQKKIPENYALRIGIKGSTGCGGANFLIGFDERTDQDAVFEEAGIEIYINRGHFLYLAGHQLNYYDEADGLGFSFDKVN